MGQCYSESTITYCGVMCGPLLIEVNLWIIKGLLASDRCSSRVKSRSIFYIVTDVMHTPNYNNKYEV